MNDELNCNACGLYFKLHKCLRPKSMRASHGEGRRGGLSSLASALAMLALAAPLTPSASSPATPVVEMTSSGASAAARILHATSQNSIIYSILVQLVILLGTANHQYTPYLQCRDLCLQMTRSNPLSFDSANSFASPLARMQYALVRMINLAIP